MAVLPSNDVKAWSEKHQEAAAAEGFPSWEVWISTLEAEKERIICGAMTKKKTPCLGAPMENGRCRRHGGKTPVGVASANWQTGEHSRLFPTLPERLQAGAERAHADPELLSLRRQIAVLEARDAELYSQLSTGESGAAWKQAGVIMQEIHMVMGDEDRIHELPQLLNTLEEVIADGLGEGRLWAEIHNNYEVARRLRDSEMKRLQMLSAAMDAREVRDIISRLLAIIRKRVVDPETLKLLMEDVVKDFSPRSERKNGAQKRLPGRNLP